MDGGTMTADRIAEWEQLTDASPDLPAHVYYEALCDAIDLLVPTLARAVSAEAALRVAREALAQASNEDVNAIGCACQGEDGICYFHAETVPAAIAQIGAALAGSSPAAEAETCCPICGHEWRRHDPEDGCCDAHSEERIGVCECGRDMAFMRRKIAALSIAALREARSVVYTDKDGEPGELLAEASVGEPLRIGVSDTREGGRHNGIPDDFWRPVPCGHPVDPVAAISSDGHAVCHCGSGLDPEQGLPDWKEFGAPGPIVECRKCGCHVAVPASPVPAVADDPERRARVHAICDDLRDRLDVPEDVLAPIRASAGLLDVPANKDTDDD